MKGSPTWILKLRDKSCSENKKKEEIMDRIVLVSPVKPVINSF